MVSRRSTQSVTQRSTRQSELHMTRRPRRLLVPKTVDDAVGLSRKEERELKKALYASLQESRRPRTPLEDESTAGDETPKLRKSTRHIVSTSLYPAGVKDRSNVSCVSMDESSQDSVMSSVASSHESKKKVHAQRKFAQGCSLPSTPNATPNKMAGSPGHSLLGSVPKTEDFLTFLCLRGSHLLPAKLDFFNFARDESALEEGSSRPRTPVSAEPGRQNEAARESSPESSSSGSNMNEELMEITTPLSTPLRLLQASRKAARASAGTPETARGIVSLRQGLTRKRNAGAAMTEKSYRRQGHDKSKGNAQELYRKLASSILKKSFHAIQPSNVKTVAENNFSNSENANCERFAGLDSIASDFLKWSSENVETALKDVQGQGLGCPLVKKRQVKKTSREETTSFKTCVSSSGKFDNPRSGRMKTEPCSVSSVDQPDGRAGGRGTQSPKQKRKGLGKLVNKKKGKQRELSLSVSLCDITEVLSPSVIHGKRTVPVKKILPCATCLQFRNHRKIIASAEVKRHFENHGTLRKTGLGEVQSFIMNSNVKTDLPFPKETLEPERSEQPKVLPTEKLAEKSHSPVIPRGKNNIKNQLSKSQYLEEVAIQSLSELQKSLLFQFHDSNKDKSSKSGTKKARKPRAKPLVPPKKYQNVNSKINPKIKSGLNQISPFIPPNQTAGNSQRRADERKTASTGYSMNMNRGTCTLRTAQRLWLKAVRSTSFRPCYLPNCYFRHRRESTVDTASDARPHGSVNLWRPQLSSPLSSQVSSHYLYAAYSPRCACFAPDPQVAMACMCGRCHVDVINHSGNSSTTSVQYEAHESTTPFNLQKEKSMQSRSGVTSVSSGLDRAVDNRTHGCNFPLNLCKENSLDSRSEGTSVSDVLLEKVDKPRPMPALILGALAFESESPQLSLTETEGACTSSAFGHPYSSRSADKVHHTSPSFHSTTAVGSSRAYSKGESAVVGNMRGGHSRNTETCSAAEGKAVMESCCGASGVDCECCPHAEGVRHPQNRSATKKKTLIENSSADTALDCVCCSPTEKGTNTQNSSVGSTAVERTWTKSTGRVSAAVDKAVEGISSWASAVDKAVEGISSGAFAVDKAVEGISSGAFAVDKAVEGISSGASAVDCVCYSQDDESDDDVIIIEPFDLSSSSTNKPSPSFGNASHTCQKNNKEYSAQKNREIVEMDCSDEVTSAADTGHFTELSVNGHESGLYGGVVDFLHPPISVASSQMPAGYSEARGNIVPPVGTSADYIQADSDYIASSSARRGGASTSGSFNIRTTQWESSLSVWGSSNHVQTCDKDTLPAFEHFLYYSDREKRNSVLSAQSFVQTVSHSSMNSIQVTDSSAMLSRDSYPHTAGRSDMLPVISKNLPAAAEISELLPQSGVNYTEATGSSGMFPHSSMNNTETTGSSGMFPHSSMNNSDATGSRVMFPHSSMNTTEATGSSVMFPHSSVNNTEATGSSVLFPQGSMNNTEATESSGMFPQGSMNNTEATGSSVLFPQGSMNNTEATESSGMFPQGSMNNTEATASSGMFPQGSMNNSEATASSVLFPQGSMNNSEATASSGMFPQGSMNNSEATASSGMFPQGSMNNTEATGSSGMFPQSSMFNSEATDRRPRIAGPSSRKTRGGLRRPTLYPLPPVLCSFPVLSSTRRAPTGTFKPVTPTQSRGRKDGNKFRSPHVRRILEDASKKLRKSQAATAKTRLVRQEARRRESSREIRARQRLRAAHNTRAAQSRKVAVRKPRQQESSKPQRQDRRPKRRSSMRLKTLAKILGRKRPNYSLVHSGYADMEEYEEEQKKKVAKSTATLVKVKAEARARFSARKAATAEVKVKVKRLKEVEKMRTRSSNVVTKETEERRQGERGGGHSPLKRPLTATPTGRGEPTALSSIVETKRLRRETTRDTEKRDAGGGGTGGSSPRPTAPREGLRKACASPQARKVTPKKLTPEKPSPSPSTADSGGCSDLESVPTFYPTEDEFSDPVTYINGIRDRTEEKFGMCRIVPPASWKMESKVNEEIRFTTQVQHLHRLYSRWGSSVEQTRAIVHHLHDILDNRNSSTPQIGGVEVDLPQLYRMIRDLGGLQNIVDKKQWVKVADAMKIPKTAHDRVTRLYDVYCKFVLPYAMLSDREKEQAQKDVHARYELSSAEEDAIFKGKSMTLGTFSRIARNVQSMWFRDDPSPEMVEAAYWKTVKDGKAHVSVQCAHVNTRTQSTAFPMRRESPYFRHSWNLNNLPDNKKCILKCLGPVSGTTIPTLHVGMLFSSSCWSTDPHRLPYVQYLHAGANTVWYCIPKSQVSKFHSVMQELCPTLIHKCPLWLSEDTAMVNVDDLKAKGVRVVRCVQQPRQFVVVFPDVYTATICCGYSLSESVHYATTEWLNVGLDAAKALCASGEKELFSMDTLVCGLCQDSTDLDTLTTALPLLQATVSREVEERRQLSAAGLKCERRLAVEDSPGTSASVARKRSHDLAQDSACEVCYKICYLSMVLNEHDEQILCLEHGLKHVQRKRHVKAAKLFYRYTEEELVDLVQTTKDRLASIAAGTNSSGLAKKRMLKKQDSRS